MKKLATLLVALVASVSTFAQVEKGTITLQPMVGLIEASTTAEGATYHAGFIGGVEGAYQVSNRVGVSVGALYAMQGTGQSDINTLNIPVLCNVYVWKGLAVKAGVQPEIVLSASANGVDFKDEVKTANVSIPVGASYDFPFGLTLDARYNIGVTNMSAVEGFSANNCAFQITAGYKFKL